MMAARAKMCYSFVGRILGWIHGGTRDLDALIPELGYTGKQLLDHLQAKFVDGMSWENFGIDGWHVDHIRPVSSFPLDTPLTVINALENLQPLWARDNLSKGAKWVSDHL